MFRAHRPFHPGRLPFFYGWVIMVCGIVGQLMSLPGQTIGISVFTDDLIQATGLSRLNLSTAYMFGTALGSFLLPLSGRFYDVAGARTAAMTAGAGLGLSLLYMSQVDFLPRLLAGDSPPTWMNFAFVLIGILMIRFTGQGTLTLISRNVLMEWFEAKRGLVNGVSGVFISLSFSAAPWMFEQFIRGFTWRGAWLILAATVGLLFPVFAWLFFRDKPEDHGLLPDGRRSRETSGTTIGNEDASREDSAQSEAKSYTAAQARRTYEFWVYSLALSVFALYATAMTFHIFSLFAKAGGGHFSRHGDCGRRQQSHRRMAERPNVPALVSNPVHGGTDRVGPFASISGPPGRHALAHCRQRSGLGHVRAIEQRGLAAPVRSQASGRGKRRGPFLEHLVFGLRPGALRAGRVAHGRLSHGHHRLPGGDDHLPGGRVLRKTRLNKSDANRLGLKFVRGNSPSADPRRQCDWARLASKSRPPDSKPGRASHP